MTERARDEIMVRPCCSFLCNTHVRACVCVRAFRAHVFVWSACWRAREQTQVHAAVSGREKERTREGVTGAAGRNPEVVVVVQDKNALN